MKYGVELKVFSNQRQHFPSNVHVRLQQLAILYVSKDTLPNPIVFLPSILAIFQAKFSLGYMGRLSLDTNLKWSGFVVTRC